MAKNYNWRIKREYYNLISKGIKTIEVRVGYPDIKRVQEGDTITFKDIKVNTKITKKGKIIFTNLDTKNHPL